MRFLRGFAVFTFGGLCYGLIEIAWRGETHISMFFAGGLCFLVISAVERFRLFGGLILLQAPFCALCITAVELVSGVIVNRAMGLGVWDYSDLPLNLWGQICLPFSALWLVLSIPALGVSAIFRRAVFFDERPPANIAKSESERTAEGY